MALNFRIASFFQCIGTENDIETLKLPQEVKCHGAIVGRSNVGKSSLINHLLQNKSLARVSSTPGKTQTINAYLIDHMLMLMDLPGYGFAKKSKEDQKKWSDLIQHYFDVMRPHFLIVLIDIRIAPTPEDFQMISWAQSFNIPVIIAITKADKIPKTKLKSQENVIKKQLQQCGQLSAIISYSIKLPQGRQILMQTLQSFI